MNIPIAIDRARDWALRSPHAVFYGVLASNLADVMDDTIATACTDGKVIRWSPKFVASPTEEEIPFVLLPDHWHTVWILPPGDDRYPLRWMRIKEEFTERWLAAGGAELPQSESREKHRQRGVWQKRYWEHTVRDEDDLKRCVDYTHWNPRKHKLAARVRDWEWSSFHRMVREGEYDLDWGGTDPTPGWEAPEWGE